MYKCAYALRPGCRLHKKDNEYTLIDDLRMVSIPINRSGYELLAALAERNEFSNDEMAFLNDLLDLFMVVKQDCLLGAGTYRAFFVPVPSGPYRSAAV